MPTILPACSLQPKGLEPWSPFSVQLTCKRRFPRGRVLSPVPPEWPSAETLAWHPPLALRPRSSVLAAQLSRQRDGSLRRSCCSLQQALRNAAALGDLQLPPCFCRPPTLRACFSDPTVLIDGTRTKPGPWPPGCWPCPEGEDSNPRIEMAGFPSLLSEGLRLDRQTVQPLGLFQPDESLGLGLRHPCPTAGVCPEILPRSAAQTNPISFRPRGSRQLLLHLL